jgi:PPP family 3-phenylpropionic acid transporter
VVLLVMFTHTSSMMPMSEAAMAHLVSQGGAFDARRYGRVRLWGSLGFLVTVFAAGAPGSSTPAWASFQPGPR